MSYPVSTYLSQQGMAAVASLKESISLRTKSLSIFSGGAPGGGDGDSSGSDKQHDDT